MLRAAQSMLKAARPLLRFKYRNGAGVLFG
jgi:hypothetical protein